MPSAHHIKAALDQVQALAADAHRDPLLAAHLQRVKQLQAQRFAHDYRDLLAQPPYDTAARFFLTELYADKDFRQRDAQFARIADAVEKRFPRNVVQVTLALAELHLLTEQLDLAMAQAWPDTAGTDALRYRLAWCRVGQARLRQQQLDSVMRLGRQLGQLTRTAGLRLMLKMMRGPASAAGLADLQRFLEAGFDAFAQMAKRPSDLDSFLNTIEQRESAFIADQFDASEVAQATRPT